MSRFRYLSLVVAGALLRLSAVGAIVFIASGHASFAAEPAAAAKAHGPKVGDVAKDFELKGLDGEAVRLSKLVEDGPVVLVVLRGYPGYQCPICNVQVGDFLGKAAKFDAADANLVFVYPGPAKGLEDKATEFLRGKTLPENVFLVVDPDYGFTNDYGLRWDAPQETAYPSTFVIDGDRKVRFAKVSTSHGGRAKASEVLEAVTTLNTGKK
ncbi:MAG: peroxiredoxin family protein [Planctomycetota bacterium]|nr:redoxin domain-containing protein [Planctomycetaceae bacterium]MDQ3332272.1 peroxiredoxin family protein [Planctomycetota bacterium]